MKRKLRLFSVLLIYTVVVNIPGVAAEELQPYETNSEISNIGEYENREEVVMTSAGDAIPIDVQAGQYYSMILKSDGTVWGTGHNSCGRIGKRYILC